MGPRGFFPVLVLTALVAACSTSVGPPIDTGSDPDPTFNEVPELGTPQTRPASGSWTGTITMEGSIDVNETKEGDNDQDPNSTYYETWTKTRSNQTQVADTYQLTAEDPASLEYGISGVQFEGTAGVTGSSDQNIVTVYDKQNSGCTWNETHNDEISGSWDNSGEVGGSLEFDEDGTYRVFLQVTPTGDYPSVDIHSWYEYSNVSANCEAVEQPYDIEMEGSPPFAWVSDNMGLKATDGSYVEISGTVSPSSATVAGTKSWEIGLQNPEFADPDADIDPINVTITWSFEHTGPITLPHD